MVVTSHYQTGRSAKSIHHVIYADAKRIFEELIDFVMRDCKIIDYKEHAGANRRNCREIKRNHGFFDSVSHASMKSRENFATKFRPHFAQT